MRTSEEYVEKLCKMRKNVYMNGELVERDNPELLPSIRVLKRVAGCSHWFWEDSADPGGLVRLGYGADNLGGARAWMRRWQTNGA